MGTYVISGSASGIGAATRSRLEQSGNTVIGVDLRDAAVVADLSTPDGRAGAVAEAASSSAAGRSTVSSPPRGSAPPSPARLSPA